MFHIHIFGEWGWGEAGQETHSIKAQLVNMLRFMCYEGGFQWYEQLESRNWILFILAPLVTRTTAGKYMLRICLLDKLMNGY